MRRRLYAQSYYEDRAAAARASARAVAPLVLELTRPASVLDVGCGTGEWLAEFSAQGVKDVLGVDAAHVPAGALSIPLERFATTDLSKEFDLGRRFDLVVSLEVAEHLAESSAALFVASLVRHGALVLFSAAIPGQLGEGHVNEQWPDYWADLFAEHEFVPVDCVRRRIWSDPEVRWWYAQNTLLYVARHELDRRPALRAEYESMGSEQLAIAHPRYVEWRDHVSAPLWRRVARRVRDRP